MIDNAHPQQPENSSSKQLRVQQIIKVNGELHALMDDGIVYVWNPAARRNNEGEWEICGLDTSDFRFWIPLPTNEVLRSAEAYSAEWLPIDSAPKDGSEIIVYCPPAHGLNHMASVCAWHKNAGFCVDELRQATLWIPLPNAGGMARELAAQDSESTPKL